MVNPGPILRTPFSWGICAIVAPALGTLAHEAGHYFAYWGFDASNIVFHYASVDADDTALSAGQIALAGIAGPLVGWFFALSSFLVGRRKPTPFVSALGVGANLRAVVGLGYLVVALLGRADKISPNFDEYNFGISLGLNPIIPVFLSLSIFLAVSIYVSVRVKKEVGTKPLLLLWAGLFLGSGLWSVFGPLLIP